MSIAFQRLILLLCVLLMPQFASAEEVGKFRVAVGDLVISSSIAPAQAKLVRDSPLMADIENAIRNGRKFELLTRRASTMSAIRKEQVFAKSELSAGDAAAEGQLSNAQAIVNVEVLSFSFGRSSKAVPNMQNKYMVSDSCRLDLSVQIVDTQRGSVLASFPITASSISGSAVVNSVGGVNRGIMDQTTEKAAGTLANMLADAVYPIQVVTVRGKQLWINRGNDSGMKMGEIFEVFEPGEELRDPQTGESLGTTEAEVGQAKVVRINPKVTVAEMTKGDAAAVKAGFILRRPVKR